MRLCTKSMNPVATSQPHAIEAKRDSEANHSARMLANRPSVPNSAGKMRQPNGPSPNRRMPSAMISLPSGGCSMLLGWLRAIQSRAAGR